MWLVAFGVVAIAFTQIFEIAARPDPAELADEALVWCHGNLALVGLAANAIGVLPEEEASKPLNLLLDDPEDQTADLSDFTAVESLALFRSVAAEAPASGFGSIGYTTDEGFEKLAVLGSRAVAQVAALTTNWIEDLPEQWEHPDAVRACSAAFDAFR